MAMKTYYVRTKEGRRFKSGWTIVRGESAENVKKRFASEHNKEARKSYAGYPDLLKKHLINPSDVAVRTTPPSRGDVYRLKTVTQVGGTKARVSEDVYVPRRKTPRTSAATRGGVLALPDRQMAVLIAKSQKIRWPTHYSNDLYVHDRRSLRKYKPRAFIWVVREWGTHLYLLDEGGKPMSQKYYKMHHTSVDYHDKHDRPCRMYLMTGTTLKSITPAQAKAAIARRFKKAYPKESL